MGRFWRTLRQECACIGEYPAYAELGEPMVGYIEKHSNEWRHRSPGYDTPAQWYCSGINVLPTAA